MVLNPETSDSDSLSELSRNRRDRLALRRLLPPDSERRLFHNLHSRNRRSTYSSSTSLTESNTTRSKCSKFTNCFCPVLIHFLAALWTVVPAVLWTLLVASEHCTSMQGKKQLHWMPESQSRSIYNTVNPDNTTVTASISTLLTWLTRVFSELIHTVAAISSMARFLSLYSPPKNVHGPRESLDPDNALPELNTAKIFLLSLFAAGSQALILLKVIYSTSAINCSRLRKPSVSTSTTNSKNLKPVRVTVDIVSELLKSRKRKESRARLLKSSLKLATSVGILFLQYPVQKLVEEQLRPHYRTTLRWTDT